MKNSRGELSIDIVNHIGIVKNNKITLFPCFIFIYLKEGLFLP